MSLPTDITLHEAFISDIFQAVDTAVDRVVNEERINKIMERAMHEKIIADTSSFLFKGFPAVADSIMSLANGKVRNHKEDYRT